MARLLLRRGSMLLAAGAGAGTLHAASLERSDTHSAASAAQQYSTYMLMAAAGRAGRWALARDCADADAVQARLLTDLLTANRDTLYGRDHGFERVLAAPDVVAAFRAAHPLTRHPDIAWYVDRMVDGETGVMVSEPVRLLGVTSGTSGARHLLPCPPSIGAHFFTRGITATFDVLFRTWPAAFSLQRTLKLTYAPATLVSPGGVRIGPASSSPADPSFKRLLPLYSTPGPAFARLPEPEALYLHLLFALRDSKLGIIEANFVSLVAFAAGRLAADWAALTDDLEAGAVSPAATPSLTPTQRAELDALLTPDPARAAEVRAAAAAGPAGLLRRLWPSLRLILANATGSFAPYSAALTGAGGLAAGLPVYSPLYAATEGLLGINTDPAPHGDGTDAQYTLMPSAMFFEFVPEERSSEAQPGTLLGSELEPGHRYEVVVTTRGGLCRWRIGDVVEFVRHEGRAPVVKFCYRRGQVLNLRGEKVSEEVAAAALADAVALACNHTAGPDFLPAPQWDGAKAGYVFKRGARGLGYYLDEASRPGAPIIANYTACESTDTRRGWLGGGSLPRYTFFLEMEPPGGGSEPVRPSAAQLDACLQRRSEVYASFRAKNAIGAPEVVQVQPGTFAALRARLLSQRGATPNQQKIPRVLRDPGLVDFLHGARR